MVVSFFLVLARVTGFIVMIPEIIKIPPSVKMTISIVFSLFIFIVISPDYDGYQTGTAAIRLILFEFIVGVFLGLFAILPITIMGLVGYYISQSSSIGNVLFPGMDQEQDSIISIFLRITAVTCVFVSGFFGALIKGLCLSYSIYNVSNFDLADTVYGTVKIGGYFFEAALRFSFPFMFITFIGYTLLAFINRLSPKISVIFVAMPGQIVIGIGTFLITLPYIIERFCRMYSEIAFAPY